MVVISKLVDMLTVATGEFLLVIWGSVAEVLIKPDFSTISVWFSTASIAKLHVLDIRTLVWYDGWMSCLSLLLVRNF